MAGCPLPAPAETENRLQSAGCQSCGALHTHIIPFVISLFFSDCCQAGITHILIPTPSAPCGWHPQNNPFPSSAATIHKNTPTSPSHGAAKRHPWPQQPGDEAPVLCRTEHKSCAGPVWYWYQCLRTQHQLICGISLPSTAIRRLGTQPRSCTRHVGLTPSKRLFNVIFPPLQKSEMLVKLSEKIQL